MDKVIEVPEWMVATVRQQKLDPALGLQRVLRDADRRGHSAYVCMQAFREMDDRGRRIDDVRKYPDALRGTLDALGVKALDPLEAKLQVQLIGEACAWILDNAQDVLTAQGVRADRVYKERGVRVELVARGSDGALEDNVGCRALEVFGH